MGLPDARIWHFGPFVLKPDTAELSKNGTPVPIEPQSLRLLENLIENRHRVVTRDALIQDIWQGRIVSDWAIAAAIKALRKSLGDTNPQKTIVRTIHSKGYRFVADITDHTPATPPAAHETTLVRLFRVISEGDDFAYLGEGLADDLITDLSRMPGLRVLSFNTSRALADTTPPGDLQIAHIIDGSLRVTDNSIRINVAVLDATGLHQTWAERFDLTRASLLAGQSRISERIAQVLNPGATAPNALPQGTTNPDAYDHYLKGRYAYFRYEPAAFVTALNHFRAATEADPTYADAFAQQAYCHTTLFVFGLPGADTTLDPAEALARKAISLNAQSAMAHARLGWVLGYLNRPDETIAAFETALACAPDNAEVHLAYGETMNRLARPDLALPLIETAFSKDSYFPPSWEFARAHAHVLLGDPDTALTHLDAVLARVDRFVPARVQMIRALTEQGNAPAARAALAALRTAAPKYSLAHAARMFPYPDPAQKAALTTALQDAGLS